MKIEVFADADSVARQAAALIAAEARAAVAKRDRFVMAVSGGHTPWIMLGALSQEDIPWAKIHIAQVDERVAPAGRVSQEHAIMYADRAAMGQTN